jgi:hypothetical protein
VNRMQADQGWRDSTVLPRSAPALLTDFAVPGGRTGAINPVVCERALHQIYYPPFKAEVQAGVGSVMSSYSRLNGTHATRTTRRARATIQRAILWGHSCVYG